MIDSLPAPISLGKSVAEQAFERFLAVSEVKNARTRFSSYRGREVEFCHEVLGVSFWEAQELILRKFYEHGRVAVVTSPNCGKSFVASCIVATNIAVHTPSKTITTASSWPQVKNVVWDEINKRVASARDTLPGRCGVVEWRNGPGCYAIGASTNNPGTLQGLHTDIDTDGSPDFKGLAKRVTSGRAGMIAAIVDEAAEVDQGTYNALRNIRTQESARELLIGNPHLEGDDAPEFRRAFDPGSGYFKIKIAAEPDHDDPIEYDAVFEAIPERLTKPGWVDEIRQAYGEDDPYFVTRCYSRFVAQQAARAVVTRAMLEASVDGCLKTEKNGGLHVGIDLARDGGDKCAASAWMDGVKIGQHTWKGDDSTESVDTIIALIKKWKVPDPSRVHIDATGLGGPMYDLLRRRGYMVDGVDFGAKPRNGKGDWPELTGAMRFANNRTYLHWILRRALQEGMASIPSKWAASWEELQWDRYRYAEKAAGTEIALDLKKSEIKAKRGRSPDVADADVLAWSRSGSRRPKIRVMGRRR